MSHGRNFLDGRVTLLSGDCLELLAAMPTKRAAVAASKNKLYRAEDLPLFGGTAK